MESRSDSVGEGGEDNNSYVGGGKESTLWRGVLGVELCIPTFVSWGAGRPSLTCTLLPLRCILRIMLPWVVTSVQ